LNLLNEYVVWHCEASFNDTNIYERMLDTKNKKEASDAVDVYDSNIVCLENRVFNVGV